jgi:hypothetical protein
MILLAPLRLRRVCFVAAAGAAARYFPRARGRANV